jgi:hypothetical protein
LPIRLKRCSGPCGASYPITTFWSDAGAPDGRMSRCPTCEKNARREAAERRASGEVAPVHATNGRLMHFSDEERKRRSELAKRLHAEGRFGGAVIGQRGGTGVRRHRIADAVLDHFRQPDKQDLVIKAVESNLKGKNKTARLSAVREIRAMEKDQDERMARDRGGAVDPSGMTVEELEEFVVQGLQSMMERGEISLADVELGEDSVQDVA